MHPALEAAELPPDAVEVGRIGEAWGLKGGFHVITYSASPEALFSSKRWYIKPAEKKYQTEHSIQKTCLLHIQQAKAHGTSGVVAIAKEVKDRDETLCLKHAGIYISRASFPTPEEDEYYWVDLIGCQVHNREGTLLGTVSNLLANGPQTTLVVEREETVEGKVLRQECLIPFVSAYVDEVDAPNKRMVVDWQLDY